MLLLNLLLALAWLLLTGQFTPANFLFGFFAAYGLLWLFGQVVQSETTQTKTPAYTRKVMEVVSFGLFFVWELILANLRVAMDVLRLTPQMQPAFVAIPLHDFTDLEVTMLANFVTLTPGTLSLDVVDLPDAEGINQGKKQRVLYVHAMHAGRTQAAIERFRDQLHQSFARRVQEVMR